MLPTRNVVSVRSSGGPGIECGCFTCCTCMNLQFLKTEVGVLKIAQVILGMISHSLVLKFGMAYSETIGSSFQSFLTTASWSCMTSALLIFCYVFSDKSFGLVRQSLFETAFNSIAAISYLTACSYLGYTIYAVLHPISFIGSMFNSYPGMSSGYVIGSIVGLLYAYDAWKSWTIFRSFR